MSRTPAIEMRALENVEHPGHDAVRAKLGEFLGRTGFSGADIASRLSLGESTLGVYLRGSYLGHMGIKSTQYLDARIWTWLRQNWPAEEEIAAEPLLETQGYRQIRECIEEAVDVGAISLVYGPPSSEKSFVAEQIVQQYRAASRRDLLYVVCMPNHSPLRLMRSICREARIWVRGTSTDVYVEALVNEFRSRELPPAIIVDEAQHLREDALESLRIGLHERTRGKRVRGGTHKGCGVVLLGSHQLYSYYMHPMRRGRFEQFFSRNSYRIQLTGMNEEEVLEIGARALGADGKKAKLTDAVCEDLLRACRVLDQYATDAEGRPLRDEKGRPAVRAYYSSRRLLEYIRQKRRMSVSKVLAEAIA